MRFYRKKSGGLFPPATGLKPCSVGSRATIVIGKIAARYKSTKNRGSHPTASFTPALDINDKRKKSIKSGRPALPGH